MGSGGFQRHSYKLDTTLDYVFLRGWVYCYTVIPQVW